MEVFEIVDVVNVVWGGPPPLPEASWNKAMTPG